MRLVLFSATEGEDKPLKYPAIFNTSDAAILTKMDLATVADFDLNAARRSIEAVRPGMRVFEVSAKTGVGMESWLDFLLAKRINSETDPQTLAAKAPTVGVVEDAETRSR